MRGYIRRWKNLNEAVTNMGAYLDIDNEERYQIMAADSKKERCQLMLEGIKRLVGGKDVRDELRNRMSQEQQDAYKVMAIKRQMKLLEEQLSELEEEFASEEEMFAERIEKAGMPEETEKEAKRVLKRFAMEGSQGHEYGTLYDYLDFITTLSWKTEEAEAVDLTQAAKILEQEHYGLEKVKKRILEQLAVMSLKGRQTGSILLLLVRREQEKPAWGRVLPKQWEENM